MRIALLFAAIFAGFLVWNFWPADKADERPLLGMSTSLPLYWGEGEMGDVLNRSAAPLEAYEHLNARYDIKLIDDFEPSKIKSFQQMILAQPRALSPAEFAAVDAWVRGGGHLVLLADPALQWDSIYPLGDKRRPLFTSLMSPLLSHWGVELVLPLNGDEDAAHVIDIEKFAIRTATPGAWRAKGAASRACKIASKAIVARCKIGKGAATLIADADFLDAGFWQGTGVRSFLGQDDFDNMDFVQALLAQPAAVSR